MSKYDNGKGGGVSETLRNYQGGVQSILTVPCRGGRGAQKSEILPYVIYERPLKNRVHTIAVTMISKFHWVNNCSYFLFHSYHPSICLSKNGIRNMKCGLQP